MATKARKSMASKRRKSADPFFLLKCRVFRSVHLDIPTRTRKNIPWIVTTDTTCRDMTRRLKEVPLGTLFVIDKGGTLVAMITTNEEAAKKASGKKGGGGGGGGIGGGYSAGATSCLKLCEQACKDQGGCACAHYDPTTGKCTIWCWNEFHKNATIGEVLGL